MQLAVPLPPQLHPFHDLPALLNHPGHLPQHGAIEALINPTVNMFM